MSAPRNRRHRRALSSALKSIEGGKQTPPDTPAQRFGKAFEAFIADYLRTHSGIDAMNVTKVVMQYTSKMSIDFGAEREDYVRAAGYIFDEELKAKNGTS